MDVDDVLRRAITNSGHKINEIASVAGIAPIALRKYVYEFSGGLDVVRAERIYHTLTGMLFVPEEMRLIGITRKEWEGGFSDDVARQRDFLRRKRRLFALFNVDLTEDESLSKGEGR